MFGNAPNYPPVSDPEALQVVLHVVLAELLSESRRVFSRGCAAPWIAAGRCQLQKIRALFDLVTARYEQAPILLTSNRTFAEWGMLLGDEVLATALLDRLLHHAEVIAINGRSYRMKDRQLPESLSGTAAAAGGAGKED